MFTSIRKHPKLLGGHSRLNWTRKSPSTEVDTHNETTTTSEDPDRTLLIHGSVEFKRGWRKQKRHLFLFSDLLLVSNSKYKKIFKIKNKIPLSTIWMADCIDTSAKRSFVLGWPTVNFVATFSSSEQKEKWRSFLQRYIDLAKEKDHPKSIPLKIFTEDIKNCAYPITVTVTNSDTTNDVINMSLPMLGVTGSKSDYQLWVSSGKKEAPYPLIGHEHPYGIKISRLQATALLPHGPKGSTSTTLQEPSLLEQPFPEMEGRFILKPRQPAKGQEQKDAGQKTVERERPKINWAFRRGSSTCQDNLGTSPPPAKPRKLFGVPLKDVCENDDLPPPLRDMFFFINQKGPLTEGIFRISASVKACAALKEKLNSGEKVNLEDESVFVVASVLKDFFRNIQDSVFSSDLYGKWLAVIDQGNEEEKITAIQRLLDQLPKANVVLLRYLFGVLHNIDQHSASNQMTAYNLSVCTAASILWSSTFYRPRIKTELRKKISLVQFLIENCFKIFGDDIPSLLEESSMIRTMTYDSEKTSEVTTEQPLEAKPVRVIVIYKKNTTARLWQKQEGFKYSEMEKQQKSTLGHEHPYGIQMIRFQATAFRPHGPKGSTSPSTLQEPSLLEQPFPEMEDAGQKTVERERPKINWAFQRGSSTCQDNLGTSPPPAKPRKLFGVPLKDVCENDNLPPPLRDMFFFINQKGPLTEGIFRISASVKARRALKQKLNSGEKVNLEDESVFVVASVLKDFFQNIQDSVFSSDLFEKWLAVIDQGNEEEKITAIQRLLDQLPKANVVLLRYLFGVLHNIDQHSASNQMTAYNLSVCTAASILWSSTFYRPRIKTELRKKISLVQFFIENCFKIFGDDLPSLMEESSMITTMTCDDSEKASEVTTEQPLESKPVRVIVIYKKNTTARLWQKREGFKYSEMETQQKSTLDAGQKTVERERPKINRAFPQGTSTCQENWCTAPPPAKPRKLFGVPLKDVCENDVLPPPLRDMFIFINQKGTLTEGIFSISGNVKACRTLKEKLNSGEKVNLEDESVFVVTSVLKDFFRNIQDSVFSSDLYDKWLAVIDQGNEEEKITAIQRLLDQLPKANVVLLRYLFGVLHNIEQHSASNQMTAYNLSVCTAPSILWSSTLCRPALKNVLTKQISLVQFLIENYFKIFGDDLPSLLEESSMITTMTCDDSEKASGLQEFAEFGVQPEILSGNKQILAQECTRAFNRFEMLQSRMTETSKAYALHSSQISCLGFFPE